MGWTTLVRKHKAGEQSPNENPDSRGSLEALPFPLFIHQIDPHSQSGEDRPDPGPQGTQITPLCCIRAAFPVSRLSVGGARTSSFRILTTPGQSLLAEGRGRKEGWGGVEAQRAPLQKGEERQGLNVQGC